MTSIFRFLWENLCFGNKKIDLFLIIFFGKYRAVDNDCVILGDGVDYKDWRVIGDKNC